MVVVGPNRHDSDIRRRMGPLSVFCMVVGYEEFRWHRLESETADLPKKGARGERSNCYFVTSDCVRDSWVVDLACDSFLRMNLVELLASESGEQDAKTEF
jgi:hypothetical protein